MSVGRRALGVAAGVAAGLAAMGAPASAESPRILYMLQCQGCHLADGAGAPGTVPSLSRVGRFLTVKGGRAYLIRVPGSATSSLSDGELAEVLNWMVREFGPAAVAADFAPFDAGEVAAVRRPPLADVDSARRELIGRLEVSGGPPRP
jgi:mono/diheme cytochrome c family protein